MASSAAAARSVIRSSSARNAVSQLYSQAKAAPSPFHVSSKFRLSGRIFRCPVKASVCVESVLPYHTATASALMKSMLSISRRSYVWLPEDSIEVFNELTRNQVEFPKLSYVDGPADDITL